MVKSETVSSQLIWDGEAVRVSTLYQFATVQEFPIVSLHFGIT
jgi:hypothetical protein